MSTEKITFPSCRHSGNNRNEQDQVSFRCGRCGYTWPRENMNSDDKMYKRGHDDGVASAKEEIDRLTRLCKEKDAEIAQMKVDVADYEERTNELIQSRFDKQLSEAHAEIAMKDVEIKKQQGIILLKDTLIENSELQLSEAQAQIAMQAEAAEKLLHKLALYHLGENLEEIFSLGADLREALSATSETVAAWRAKETEPLRREVAMLVEFVKSIEKCEGKMINGNRASIAARNVLNNTKATALAYEQEVRAKALEEFGEKYRCIYLIHRGTEVYIGPELKELADKEAAELRAANKGEVK